MSREAYSHEVSSAGFWPGGSGVEKPMFYAYSYPEPPGFKERMVQPDAAYFDHFLGEFLLPYAAVRQSSDPAGTLTHFLQSTYEAAVDTGGWDRAGLEVPTGRAGVPRTVPARM